MLAENEREGSEFYHGDAGQLMAAIVGIATNLLWVGGAGYAVYRLVDALVGHRAHFADELRGLDVSELGIDGYFDEDNVPQPSAMHDADPDPGFSSGHTSTWHHRLYCSVCASCLISCASRWRCSHPATVKAYGITPQSSADFGIGRPSLGQQVS